jgi:hypothetical protein
MLGVLVRLNKETFYLCPICLKISNWFADGSDLFPRTYSRTFSSDDIVSFTTISKADVTGYCCSSSTQRCSCISNYPRDSHIPAICTFCPSKCNPRSQLLLPCVRTKCMMNISFCTKHVLPVCMTEQAYEFDVFQSVASEYFRRKSLNKRKRVCTSY